MSRNIAQSWHNGDHSARPRDYIRINTVNLASEAICDRTREDLGAPFGGIAGCTDHGDGRWREKTF